MSRHVHRRSASAPSSTAPDAPHRHLSARRGPRLASLWRGPTAATLLWLCAAGLLTPGAGRAEPTPTPATPAPAGTASLPARERGDIPSVSLQQALERAQAHSPSAKVALLIAQRAEAQVAQARAQALPQLTANGTYTRLDNDRALGERVLAYRDQLNLNLNLQVPLVAPRAWSAWSRASERAEVAKLSEREARQQLAISVARTYLAALTQRRIVEVSERAHDTAEAHERYARSRREGGLGNRLDEVRAAQEVATTAAQLAAAKVALRRAQEALGVLVGENGPRQPDDAFDLQALPDEAAAEREFESRPDVRAQRARARSAQHQKRDNWVDFLPMLTGAFQPFYQNPPTPTMPQTGWQAQLLLTLPLYDGGARYGVHRERAADAELQQAQLEDSLRQAKADVRVAAMSVHHADEALGQSREAAKLAQESLRLATLAYEAGASTNLEVIDAERRARDAETDVAVKEDSARAARLDLLIASGRYQ